MEQEVWILFFVFWVRAGPRRCLLLLLRARSSLQVSVLLVRHFLLQQDVHRDDPAVVELSVQHHLLLLHLRLRFHHLQRGVVMVTVLHRVQLICQVLL